MIVERGHLLTEQANPQSANLDRLKISELVELFNQEDAYAVAAVGKENDRIASASP
jgi:N-acetylmuramic acid 6-phosphate etherase